ncbi:MAG: threonine synthase [Ruminococcaceae bacterium]|nr:threonine synthase [Oscillospiraceae bacterium]
MHYISTRRSSPPISGSAAILQGLAPDGGLYLPEKLPQVDWQALLRGDTFAIAAGILSAFFPEIPQMDDLVRQAYSGKFQSDELTPLVKVGDRYVLELFRGPTSAFKDVALCMLPRLMMAAKQVCGHTAHTTILTATSGDTGKAALEGFRDVPGIDICVFYPHGGVSDVQRRQMVSQEGENVRVCAIRGNFDDCQTGVKQIFAQNPQAGLSSANSINIGRLVPQITYYFTAYRDLLRRGAIALGDQVNFSVPTGNFGDILAGFLAKKMGLPVGKLICASNDNDVLTKFLATGTYDRLRPLYKTKSPSMDILVSSNLERLLALMAEEADLVPELMGQLDREGRYHVPAYLLTRIRNHFHGGCCGGLSGQKAIGDLWRSQGYLMDTHTAAGWKVAEDYVNQTGDTRPMVVLSTASPYKFPAAVLAAVTADPSLPLQEYTAALLREPAADGFTLMDRLHDLTAVPVPKNLANLREKPERHTAVIEKEEMPQFVFG